MMGRRGADRKIDAYYDGQCPMCSALMQSVRGADETKQFRLHDMHRTNSLPFDREAVEREIHVVGPGGDVRTGADAILFIAEQFPALGPLMRIARSRPASAAAPLVYRFVAANRWFLFGPGARLYGLKWAASLTLCIELAMSWRLWIGPRTYPLAPVFRAMPSLPDAAAFGLYAVFFLASAAALFSARPRRYIGAVIAALLIFCVFDQTRWQPWLLMLGALLLPLAFFSWDAADARGRDRSLNIARLIIVSTYVYAGLQKINVNFTASEFPWIVSPITDLLPRATGAMHAFGLAAPFIQVAFGAGLLVPRFRRVALAVAVSMHVFILLMFGPLGLNWNEIVWPWTAAMAVFDLLLFAGDRKTRPRDILLPGRNPVHALVLLLFAVMPAFSFFNLWDSYLSSALYSGNLTDGVIYVSDAGKRSMAPRFARWLVHSSPNTNVLNLQRWTIEELNVSNYAETRVYKDVARAVCAQMADPAQLVLTVREQRAFFSRPETSFGCADL